MDTPNSVKISVVINTYNEEKRLPRVLETLCNFDEVVVCDMESTDATQNIAHKFGCKVVIFPRGTNNICEAARDFAIHQASHPWVFVVDADELVPQALRDYLYNYAARDDAADGLYISRKSYFMGRMMHGYYPDQQLRFFKRDRTQWPAIIHMPPTVDGQIAHIPANRKELAFIHIADFSVSNIVRKTNDYTDNEVPKREHKHYGVGALLTRPFFRFFKAYILKGGFRDGVPGFCWALLQAFYQVVMLSKLQERRRGTTISV